MEQRPLHWSERAKMFPGAADADTDPGSQPKPSAPDKKPSDKKSPEKKPKTRSSHKGLLITLLIILVIAAAAVVIFLWYLPSRGSDTDGPNLDDQQQLTETSTDSETVAPLAGPIAAAKDIEAMTLVRNSMLAVQSLHAAAGTYDLQDIPAALLQQMATVVTFTIRDDDQAAKAPTSLASDMAVDIYGTLTGYALGTQSDSGRLFGVIVNAGSSIGATTYYVDGQVQDWSTQLVAR